MFEGDSEQGDSRNKGKSPWAVRLVGSVESKGIPGSRTWGGTETHWDVTETDLMRRETPQKV